MKTRVPSLDNIDAWREQGRVTEPKERTGPAGLVFWIIVTVLFWPVGMIVAIVYFSKGYVGPGLAILTAAGLGLFLNFMILIY